MNVNMEELNWNVSANILYNDKSKKIDLNYSTNQKRKKAPNFQTLKNTGMKFF